MKFKPAIIPDTNLIIGSISDINTAVTVKVENRTTGYIYNAAITSNGSGQIILTDMSKLASGFVYRFTVDGYDLTLPPGESGEYIEGSFLNACDVETTTLQYLDACGSTPADATGDILAVTWAILDGYETDSELTPGQLYSFSFQTKHVIPNSGGVINTGTAETLILQALANNKLHHVAKSVQYPQDEIWYELNDSSTAGGDKGRIYYRKDTSVNIDAWCDWRNVKFDDSGTAKFMFNNSQTAATCSDISIGRKTSGDQLTIFVCGSENHNIEIGEDGVSYKLGNNNGRDGGKIIIGNRNGAIVIGGGCGRFGGLFQIGNGNCFPDGILTVGSNNGLRGTFIIGNYNSTDAGVAGYNITIGNLFSNFRLGDFNNADQNLTINSTTVLRNCGDNNLINITGSGNNIAIGSNNIVVVSGDTNYITLGNNVSVTGIAVSNKTGNIDEGFSSLDITLSITGLTTLDITAANDFAGIANLTSTNATESIDTISNFPTNHPVTFYAANGLVVTFVTGAVIILSGGANWAIDGSKGDYIVLEKRADGKIYQIGGAQY